MKFMLLYVEKGEVHAWGWKECVPSGKIVGDFLIGRSLQKDASGKQSSLVTEQGGQTLFLHATE